ncbi:HEPN domain-containing protein [Thermodesulfovibrio hydrogeniphilus]
MFELCLNGILRFAGIEPPKYHYVSKFVAEYRSRFPEINDQELEKIIHISKSLRKERELAFYGDIDFIPTEEYTEEDAKQAMTWANYVYDVCLRIVK